MTSPVGPELAHAANVLLADYLAVERGASVLITADTASDRAVVEAVMNGASALGAQPVLVVMLRLPFQGAPADPYIPAPLAAAAKECEVWIDLTFPYIAGSRAHDEAMSPGRARYLLASDLTAEGMVRLFARVDLDRLFAVHHAFDAVVGGAIGRQCRITNDTGTEVTFTIAKPAFGKPRRAEKPGLYFVPGMVTIFPEPESVRGAIGVDAAFHEYYTAFAEPMTLGVDGKIHDISGGGSEREVMDRALRRAGGGDYGHVIHFTCGIHPAARFTGASFVEDARARGNDAVGLGIPFWQPGGGENHPDAVIKRQSIWIDGEQVVKDGAIVGPPDLAERAAQLEPVYG